MNQSNDSLEFLRTPNRQSQVAMLLILLRLFRTIIRQAWPILLVLLINPSRNSNNWIAWVVIGIASLSAILSIISYFKFYYYVQDDELVIEKGIFNKVKLNVPFDRIQTVNFNQSIIHQLFDVVELEVDTAGSNKKEYAISALGKDRAQAIRSYLIRQSQHSEASDLEVVLPAAPSDELLLQLKPSDLLKVGVGQNHLPAIGIMWVTAYGIFEIVEKALGKAFDQRIEELELNFNNFWTTFLMVLPFILTIAVLITMIRTMLRYYDLRFLKTSEGFKVIGGLFNRREQSAKMDKIQLVNWSRNPISRLFHLFDLGLKQASSNQVSMKQSIYVPGCYIDQVNQVLQAYYPEQEGRHFTEFQVDKALIVRQVFYLGIVPAAIVTALRVMAAGSIGFLFLLWIPLTYFSARYYHQKWKFEIGRDALRLQRGFFGTKSSLLKWYKVQNVRIKQSPYQQRKGLASVVFFTAGGAIQIPYIDLALAHQIHDYALYQVESSDLPWM